MKDEDKTTVVIILFVLVLLFNENKGKYQSGQMGQTVNLLAFAFGGSNPSLPTRMKQRRESVGSFGLAEVAQLIEH